jgi:hypothetical protein
LICFPIAARYKRDIGASPVFFIAGPLTTCVFPEEFRKHADKSGGMIQRHLSGSASQAQAILGAWKSGNRERFWQELDRVQVGAEKSAPEAAETDRMELLCAIAENLRVSPRELAPDDAADICGLLLRHLAAPSARMERRDSRQRPATFLQ